MSKSIQTLRDDLYSLFDKLKVNKVEVEVAAEMNNTAGKIINTLRAELEYASQRGVEPSIPFMDAMKPKRVR